MLRWEMHKSSAVHPGSLGRPPAETPESPLAEPLPLVLGVCTGVLPPSSLPEPMGFQQHP